LTVYHVLQPCFKAIFLFIGFRKAKLKKIWAIASLRTETLRVMLMEFLAASLRADFKRDYAKKKLRENMGQSESKERDFKEQK
jgi:hypothetical protein